MTSTKPIVDWGTACGRTYLEVAGITVAVEGDPERDGTLGIGNTWTNDKLKEVVRRAEAALQHQVQDLHAERRELRDRVRALSAWLDGVEVALRTNDRTTAEEEPPLETVAMRVAQALRDAYLRGRYDESYTASIGSMGRLK